jgi:hypothetical protein
MDVSPSHIVPPFGLQDGAATHDHGEQCVDIVPQKEQYFLQPDRRVGHQKMK